MRKPNTIAPKQEARLTRLSTGPVFVKARRTSGEIDPWRRMAEHRDVMLPVVYARERRSSRMFMRIRVMLAGRNQEGRRFRHAYETIVINAHGALLYLDQEVEMGSLLVLTNPLTQDEQECRVVYLGEESDKGRRVGIEFLTPSPHFWGVEFVQPDWTAQPTSFQKN